MAKRIALGDRVQDRVTGFKGIAIGMTDWLFGCRRIAVQPEGSKGVKGDDENRHFDEESLRLLKAQVITRTKTAAANGGPRPAPQRAQDPTR